MGSKFALIETCGPFRQLDIEYDLENRAVWYYLNPHPRPCFNVSLLRELGQFQRWVERTCGRAAGRAGRSPLGYVILASRTPGVFNFGGDLDLFLHCIETKDRQGLEQYARSCIDVLHANASCFGIPDVTTISLVQGHALGGGFEAAVSSTVVIAEERARFGLPEILFNLFPGMGALSFLSRKLNRAQAERMILSGDTFTASNLCEIGLVDVLAPDGEGERVARDFMRRHTRRANAHQALSRACRRLGEVSKEELLDITNIWVDAAVSLDSKDLRTMRRLVGAQNRRNEADEGNLDAVEA